MRGDLDKSDRSDIKSIHTQPIRMKQGVVCLSDNIHDWASVLAPKVVKL